MTSDSDYNLRLKKAMEEQWQSRSAQNYNKKARWIDGKTQKSGGHLLPGFQVEDTTPESKTKKKVK